MYSCERDRFAALAEHCHGYSGGSVRFVLDQTTSVHTARQALVSRESAQSLLRCNRNEVEIGNRPNVSRLYPCVIEEAMVVRDALVRMVNELAQPSLLERDNLLPRGPAVPKEPRHIEHGPERRSEIHSAN